jgi:FAD/FMN-containing dehydrogenase
MTVQPGLSQAGHAAGVERLLASYRAIPATSGVRLAKRTSNLFRPRVAATGPGLDVSGLTRVIAVDPLARTAEVAGMCTYEDVVAATLPYGLVPLVVPQLKTITVGGAVSGLGIESTSFRNGMPHESVLELDVLTGAGEVVTASPDRHSDLFRAFPNSYGTLGYAVRLRFALEPVRAYVGLRHLRFRSVADLVTAMEDVVEAGRLDGIEVDYVDGVVFSPTEAYLCLGHRTDAPGPVSDYTGRHIYYRSIQHEEGTRVDRLTTHDYLWRWDTDWFWCSAAFGAQHPVVRRCWPRRLRRSSVYGKLLAVEHRFDLVDRVERARGRPPRERVVQDVEVPVERCAEFLEWFLASVPIVPIWVCPVRLRDRWTLYPMEPRCTYVNLGFWSTVPRGATPGATNRRIEQQVRALDGHKSLYSEAFYPADEFDQLYNGEGYRRVKATYDPGSRLLDLYAKAVQRR